MASIWNDIVFEWEDETITVRPTLDFINKLEQKRGSGLSTLLSRIGSGDLPVVASCNVIGITLRHAGKHITDEEVYAEFLNLQERLGSIVGTILAGCLPMPKGEKAPGKPQRTRHKKN